MTTTTTTTTTTFFSSPRFFPARNEASRRAKKSEACKGGWTKHSGSLLQRAGWPRRVAKRGSATVGGWWKRLLLFLAPYISLYLSLVAVVARGEAALQKRQKGRGRGGCREWSRGARRRRRPTPSWGCRGNAGGVGALGAGRKGSLPRSFGRPGPCHEGCRGVGFSAEQRDRVRRGGGYMLEKREREGERDKICGGGGRGIIESGVEGPFRGGQPPRSRVIRPADVVLLL